MAHLDHYNASRDLLDITRNLQIGLIEKFCIEFNCPDRVEEFTAKFIDPTARLKKFKDPNAPKRPKTSYIFFCADERAKLKKGNKKVLLPDVMKICSEKWRSISDEERKKYNDMAEEDKERYTQECEKYNDKLYSPNA